MSPRRLFCIAAIFATLSLACTGSTAPHTGTSSAFTARTANMGGMGFRAVGQPSTGAIVRNQTIRHAVHLNAGECYRFMAFGDSGSLDLELAVVSPGGERAVASETSGPEATTRFCPTATGEFSIAVSAR